MADLRADLKDGKIGLDEAFVYNRLLCMLVEDVEDGMELITLDERNWMG